MELRNVVFATLILLGAGGLRAAAGQSNNVSLSGSIKDAAGNPVPGVTITLTSEDDKPQSTKTGRDGGYALAVPKAGTYELSVQAPTTLSGTKEQVTLNGREKRDFTLRPAYADPTWTQTGWCVVLLVLYWFIVLLVTWHNVAKSVQRLLSEQLRAMKTRLITEAGDANPTVIEKLDKKVDEITNDADPPEGWKIIPEFLFWSRGREHAAWVALHEVERQLTAFLAPPPRVLAALRSADADLRQIGTPSAIAIADAIRDILAAGAPAGATVETEKALLARATTIIYENRDIKFSTLMEWQNKAGWLILAALLLIGFITAACGHSVLFLAGGAGGYLSRLMRALRRENLPLDYGASWTTLFLSPLFGALAAWFGIAMITLAAQPEVNLLGRAFQLVKWDDPSSPMTLAAAFLLGFSERWFDAVVGALDKHAEGQETASAGALRAGAPPQPAAPRAAAAGQPAQPPPTPSAGGATIQLPAEPITPVQVVHGKIVLDKPADTDFTVALSSNQPEFPVQPQAITIAKGQSEVSFEVVPRGDAGAEQVTITATINNVSISGVIDFH